MENNISDLKFDNLPLEVFANLHDAARKVGGNASNLFRTLYGGPNYKTFSKLHWELVEERKSAWQK